MTPPIESTGRKDLQDLCNLPRSPLFSYLQRQAAPRAPRVKSAHSKPQRYPILSTFASTRVFKWLVEYLSQRIGPRHPFPTYSKMDSDQGVYALKGDDTEIRIALAGDWGTGTDEAECVGKSIRKFKPHYSIHLGDVYYVGGPQETDENFLGVKDPSSSYHPCHWPPGLHGSFAMNGNHEMYARGFAYFDRMLPKLGLISNGKPQGQKASFFCLENDHWRIIALDTGYNSIGWPLVEYFVQPACDLRPEQIAWLREIVRPRKDDPRGIILLTHHQYYSRFDDWYPNQAKQLAEFFTRPVLWFWGHEHRIAIYPEYRVSGGVRAFGRCIGHGGMPIDLPPAEPKHPSFPVEFVDTRKYPNDENLTVGYNGYAQMSLRGNQAQLRYIDLHGTQIFAELWVAQNGALQRIHVADGLNRE